VKCPFCGYDDDKVIETRQIEDGSAIRRRRECSNCMKRFTTYEHVETIQIMVVKKDGSRQVFDRSKIMKGILRACEKRNASSSDIERLTNSVETEIMNLNRKEVSSEEIAELIMRKLREFDQVAYVRFASVYKQFKDIDSFMDELNKLKSNKE
jgi:transcriptional repressor NrdR